MKTEIKKEEDLTNVVNALVEAYGEEQAFAKIGKLLPRPEPLYYCRLGKGPNSRWMSDITVHDDAIVIHLSTEPAVVSKWQTFIFEDIVNSKVKMRWSDWCIYERFRDVLQDEKVSQDG